MENEAISSNSKTPSPISVKQCASLIALAVCICLLFGAGQAFADTVSSASGSRSFEASGKLVKKKGNTYYKYKKVASDGSVHGKTQKARNRFVTIKKKTYFFNRSGKMHTGWKKIKSNYYYFNRFTGVQKKSSKIDGIKIRKNGKAVKSSYNVKKIETMMKARKIMLANTKYSDSKATKRYKVFKWVMSGYYRQFRTLKSTGHKRGWELTFANDMFGHGKKGCCVSNACAFAYLAKECGYKDVSICDDTGHGFVVINGKYYDTLFAEVHGMYNYYNAPKSRAAKDFLVNKLKI